MTDEAKFKPGTYWKIKPEYRNLAVFKIAGGVRNGFIECELMRYNTGLPATGLTNRHLQLEDWGHKLIPAASPPECLVDDTGDYLEVVASLSRGGL